MNRRQLLNNACGIGMCSCLGALLPANEIHAAEVNTDIDAAQLKKQNDKLNWWADHTKKQLAELWRLLEPHLDEDTRNNILEQLGRNCARSTGSHLQFKGNPEGFLNFVKKSGDEVTYDKDKGIICVTGPERDSCACGMVDRKITPPYFCQCSVGWQKEMYEAVFGKKVECELVESVLRGSKRCAFKNTLKA